MQYFPIQLTGENRVTKQSALLLSGIMYRLSFVPNLHAGTHTQSDNTRVFYDLDMEFPLKCDRDLRATLHHA